MGWGRRRRRERKRKLLQKKLKQWLVALADQARSNGSRVKVELKQWMRGDDEGKGAGGRRMLVSTRR